MAEFQNAQGYGRYNAQPRYEGIFDLISILLAANARFTPSHFFGLISSVPFIGSFLIMYLLTYHAFAICIG